MSDDKQKKGKEAVKAALANTCVVDLNEQKEKWRSEGDIRGYDVSDLNERYAIVMIGGQIVILQEDEEAPLEDQRKFIRIDAFHIWHANDLVRAEDKTISVSQLWMRDPQRRQYRGVMFEPESDKLPHGYLNLWRGFSVEPSNVDKCDVFFDHVRTNIAGGDETIFNFIMAWAAHIIQRPTERTGISLVFRGKMGTGKTIFGEIIGQLFENHYILVDDPRYLTGQFNAHMASCLLLQADEGFWAGDVKAEGRLKGLVTSKKQMIEMKGKDPIPVKNYVHLLISSNNDWIVPAGHDERRFAIFDVGDNCIQNHAYFKAMFKELENGGYEALLHYLQNYDLDSVDLYSIPRTKALLDQKMMSLDPHEAWWFECLQQGWIVDANDGAWPDKTAKSFVHSSYLKYCERIGIRSYKKDKETLGRAMRKIVPGLSVGRSRRLSDNGTALPCFSFPSLEKCRDEFAKMLKSDIEWEQEFDEKD